MRFSFSRAVVLVSLSSFSPAFGQATQVKAQAKEPSTGEATEVTEAAEEPKAASSTSEEPESAPAEVEAPPPTSEVDEDATSPDVVPTETSVKRTDAPSEEPPEDSQADKVAGGGVEEEAEIESEAPADPAVGGATETPPESSTGGSDERAAENWALARTGFVFAPRLGLTVGGATHLGSECEETGNLGCGTFGIRDHKEASGFGIAADALYGLIPELRLGATLMWLPQAKGDAGGDLRRLGTEVHLQAVAEGVFDLIDRLAVTVRVQGGGAVLAPSGFVDDIVKEAQDDCEVARDAGVDCTVSDGPYFAPVFGGGAGLLVQTKGVTRLRLDFLFETQTMPIYEQKAASDSGTVSANVTMDQSRFWLLGGFEI